MTSTVTEKTTEGSSGALKYVSVADLTDLMVQTAQALETFSQEGKAFRTVLDSLTPLFIYNPPLIVAKFLRNFVLKVKGAGSAGVVITYVDGSIDSQSELIMKSSVDNLLYLRERELVVEGMLGTPKLRMAYQITDGGMKVGF